MMSCETLSTVMLNVILAEKKIVSSVNKTCYLASVIIQWRF